MKVFESDHVTVYKDVTEVLVFGEGSDWIVRYPEATNPKDCWRKWFAYREDAEKFAQELCGDLLDRKAFGKVK